MRHHQPDRVVIINDRSERVGGASNLAVLSAELIRERGIPVTYFAGDTIGAGIGSAEMVGVGGQPLVNQGKLTATIGGLYNQAAYDSLRTVIARTDSPGTIYHVHGWSKILSPSIFRALWRVRSRVVLHAHDYFLSCPNGGYANYQSHRVCNLTPMSARCLTTQCDKRGYHEKVWRSTRHLIREHFFPTRYTPANIVIVHQHMHEYFTRAGINAEYIRTIRNPVEPFLQAPPSPAANKPFFFIGRLEPEKGFEDAAKAARLANVPLHVIGDGAGRAVLERDYPEVVLHGWKNKDEIAALVTAARCIVISSRVPEPFGLAAVEAVASGIPVIIPQAALLAREIAELGCGLPFENGNIAALAAAMTRLAGDDAMVRAMSENCLRQRSSMAHTSLSWAEALFELYDEILERAHPGQQAALAG